MAISAKDLTAKDAVAFIKKRPIPIVCGLASLLLLVGGQLRQKQCMANADFVGIEGIDRCGYKVNQFHP